MSFRLSALKRNQPVAPRFRHSATVNLYNFDFTLSHEGDLAPLIAQRASALLNELKTADQLQAVQRTTQASEPVVTDQEREAANLVVESVGGAGPGGRGGGDGRGGDGQAGRG